MLNIGFAYKFYFLIHFLFLLFLVILKNTRNFSLSEVKTKIKFGIRNSEATIKNEDQRNFTFQYLATIYDVYIRIHIIIKSIHRSKI